MFCLGDAKSRIAFLADRSTWGAMKERQARVLNMQMIRDSTSAIR